MKKSPLLGALKSPQNDLSKPLNDAAASEGLLLPNRASLDSVSRVRKNTAGSDDWGEKVSKIKINMDDNNKKGALRHQHFNAEFRFNAEMALRVAVGVIIASFIQTKNPDYRTTDERRWFFFPSWYYLGGLSYCAVAVIFSAQKNVGATTREVCQAFYGVGMALVYNIILFACLDMQMYDHPEIVVQPGQRIDGYVTITKNFGTNPYYVNTHNFLAVLPWMMGFTIAILLMPIETNTKKFALGNNLYFALTIINPMNPQDLAKFKETGDTRYDTSNVLKNLQLYFLVGFIGTLISFFIMFVPYPIFAINRLREETQKASSEIQDLLNIIIDSYCFKNKNVEHMNFLRVKLHRKFEKIRARHVKMDILIEDVWWEQLFGFHVLLKFNRSMIKNYVRLVGSLVSDLRTLNNAMQLEKYENLHFQYMKTLQREIYMIQLRSGDLLNEISQNVHDSVPHLDLQCISPLETQMEHTLQKYRTTQNRILRTGKISLHEVEGNVPLNLFLFSLNSMCSTLIDFQAVHNGKIYETTQRAKSFIQNTIIAFFDPEKYNRLLMMSAFKASLAIFAGTMLAVYVYAFSHTTPNAVAFVMGNHIGGSFSVTVNRVGGVVAGSVIPSVFQFFIAQVCNPQNLSVVLSDVVLFLWVAASMFVRFSGGFASYAGLVSAFIAAGVMLKQSDADCGAPGTAASIAISSYSSMAQTSVGILLFIIVELALCPESASGLLRENIQQTLWQLHKAFDVLFGHHLASTDEMDEHILEELRVILQVKVPKLLAEQAKLVVEAGNEPTLWRQPFSAAKYEAVLDSCYRLLNNCNVLFKLVKWFNYRVKTRKLDFTHSADIRNAQHASDRSLLDIESTHNRWTAASNKFQASVSETFDTLHLVFGEGFLYADQEQTALFMQMKEAFRLADKDCSGEIDAEEVEVMLEAIFAQSGGMKENEIHDYVEQFMEIVDHDHSGKVSFEEFTKALDNGLKLEVEVYTRRKPKAAVLSQVARPTGLSIISEEGEGSRSSVHSTSRASRGSVSAATASEKKPPLARGSGSRLSGSGVATTLAVAAATGTGAGGGGATPKASKLLPLTPKKQPIVQRMPSGLGGGGGPSSPMMRRQHDVLNVADFTLGDIAAAMKASYVEWLMEGNRFEKVSMEELLLLNCLVSGAEGIARQLTAIEEIVVSH